CVASTAATIMQPDELLVDRLSKDIDCFGNSNGEIDLIIRGGTALYTFMWSDGFAAEDRTGLLPGIYETTVTDAAGCFSAASIAINQPASALSASTTVQDATCFGGANGIVDLAVSGGTLPYT